MQSRKRDTDVEIKRMDTKREAGWWNEVGDWDWHVYTIDTIYKIDTNENLLYSTGNSTQCSVVT